MGSDGRGGHTAVPFRLAGTESGNFKKRALQLTQVGLPPQHLLRRVSLLTSQSHKTVRAEASEQQFQDKQVFSKLSLGLLTWCEQIIS